MRKTNMQTGRRYQEVARRIIAMLEQSTVRPGNRLPAERELATQLGVSRPTVREAMVALDLAGFVDIRTGSGIYVRERGAPIPTEGLSALTDRGAGPIELIEARMWLEPPAAAAAAKLATAEDINAMRASLKAMEDSSEVTAHREADHAFHVALAKASQNTVVTAIIDQLWLDMFSPLFERMGLLMRLFPSELGRTLKAHHAILEAIEDGDAETAEKSTREHLSRVLNVLSDPAPVDS